jgi:hypothetical protein
MQQHKRPSKLRSIAVGLCLVGCAVIVGLASAWWVLKKAPWMNPTVQVGAWKANLRAGSTNADMYTRANVALNGLLALGREETLYFIASHDDAGRPLRSACHYRVQGLPPQARWWSVTAYADDLFLFNAPNHHYSLNGSTAKLDEKGQFAFTTGPDPSSDAPALFWLPTPGERGLVLTLRLYNPAPGLQASPSSLVPPTIQALGGCA